LPFAIGFRKELAGSCEPRPVERMTLHLLLLRHAETDANVAGILQGHLPTDLNAAGRVQAERLARRLQGYDPRIGRLVSSDLPRALQTAGPISAALGLPVEIDRAWRERSYGRLEGVDAVQRDALRRTGDDEALGAEPVVVLEQRLAGALRGITDGFATLDRSRAIAIVTHGGVIRRILRMLREGRLPTEGELPDLAPIRNASIFHLAWSDRAFRSLAFNDDTHLGAVESTAIDID
jgi:probable phosphoglycerate mutase